jgi:hypothetical protein
VEPGADGDELRLELALCGLDRDLRRPLLDTNDLDAARTVPPRRRISFTMVRAMAG